LIESIQFLPSEYLKHLEGTSGLYEIRIQNSKTLFRIFCFFDHGKLIVLANGFQKKSRKTTKSEIEKALAIKTAYEKTKRSKK
jgi:phage-related protein